VRRFLPRQIQLVLDWKIDHGRMSDYAVEQAAEGNRSMDECAAIKTLLRP